VGVSAANHQEVECIYVANGTFYTSELTVSGPEPRPVDSQLKINSASCWLLFIYCSYTNKWVKHGNLPTTATFLQASEQQWTEKCCHTVLFRHHWVKMDMA
jgi:hypothetical protein